MSIQSIVAGAVLAALSSAPVCASSVWINEIHYDNAGSDVGEFVEIAGPAGTDLNGWSLVLYNGSSGAPYDTEVLSGPLTDVSGGFGFLSVNVAGIQNGAPDGLALVDDVGGVVQLLSYEGVFSATSGPAAGLMSTDIGVFEPVDTPVGFSLQLTGLGNRYADFSWADVLTDTRGGVNGGQVLLPDRTLSAVPIPAALPLFGSALALFGIVGRRRGLGGGVSEPARGQSAGGVVRSA